MREYSVDVDGVAVNIVDHGTGPAVVLLHGWQMSWHSWTYQIPALAVGHRVVAVDLPGFGASEALSGVVTIPRYADVVLAVCDRLGIRGATFVGNSMGGFVATEIALTAPERVRALVLVAAAGMSRRYVLPKAVIRHPIGDLGARIVLGPVSTRLQRTLGLVTIPAILWGTFADRGRLDADITRDLVAAFGRPGAYAAGLACARHESRQQLGELRCPTLIVWGAADRLQSVRNAHRYRRAISGSRVVVYPRTGHCPQIECPDEFNRDVLAFLRDL